MSHVIAVDPAQPDDATIRRAAELIRAGQLVAFPTETVYGLGANALDARAVASIFAAKGRPAKNPLIVHVADAAGARSLVRAWPPAAARLAERFWPGPLTLVLPKRSVVPDIVTAGRGTVALRVPASNIALALLRAANCPIAAPSANPSGRLSPTRAEHVRAALAGRVALILDGGPTRAGIESTVVDLSHSPPQILRPGPIPPSDIAALAGPLVDQPIAGAPFGDASAGLPAPGMLDRHYAPRAALYCCDRDLERRAAAALAAGNRVGVLVITPRDLSPSPGLIIEAMPREPAEYARLLYDTLHRLDAAGVDVVLVESPPTGDAWWAIRDRLQRAAHDEERD
ncbi:MAG: L-threonylcarbamoyladenylate synthase [Phycisphaerae bacterium]